jgi:prepilin peptidase CpaA
MLHVLSISLLPTLVIIAAMIDATSYKIPNWLTVLTAVLFLPMALWSGMPINEMGWHLLAGLVLFFVGYALFSFGIFGGGDAKLMAAAGLWFGPSTSVEFLVFTTLAGGVLAMAIIIWTQASKIWDFYSSKRTAQLTKLIKHINPKLPYGVALCVGAILAFPNTWWMTVG